MSRSKKVNSKAGEKDDQPQAQEPPALNGPETTSAKRPGNMINNDSPKKTPPRKSIKLDGPKARQFTIFTTATAVEDIEAYYIEQYPGQDGFAFHLWQDIMQERNATDLNDAGFFFCGDRRVSKEDNSPLENIERAKNGKKYTRRYVLRSLPASEGERMSTPETRDEGLHVLLKYCQRNQGKYKTPYVISPTSDQTPQSKSLYPSLDELIVNEDIMQILDKYIDKADQSTFAKDWPEFASAFFSTNPVTFQPASAFGYNMKE